MNFSRASVRIARIASVLALALASPASAQDRGYNDSYRPPSRDGAYAEGETRDGYPVPQGPADAQRGQQEYHPSYKDDAPPPPPRPRREARCLDKFGIQRALHDQGWHEFDNVSIEGPVAYMTARSDRGEPFDLKIESCNGSVIEAHPLYVRREGPAYYYPRPAVGFYFGGGGYRHWR